MMKKLIIVLLVVMMLFSLTACKQHTVTFVDSEGEVVETVEIPWLSRFTQEGISLPEAAEIPGYQFLGWYLEPGNSKTKLHDTYFVTNRVDGDVTAYACYIDSRYEAWPIGNTGTAVITGADESVVNAQIPDTVSIIYNGITADYTVVEIGSRAFDRNSNIESVVVPSTVTAIRDNAFSNCENLKSVVIPDSITDVRDMNTGDYMNIGKNVFDGTALETVEAPTWIVDICLTSESRRGLVDVTFNAGNAISIGMFKDAKLLESVTLCSTINSIKAEAFWNASSLKSIHIPASVVAIADSAFAYCSSLEQITVDEGNDNYESNNSNCIVLREKGLSGTYDKTLIAGCSNTDIYYGINKIAKHAFNGCTNLTVLNIPASVVDIAEGAFDYCASLSKINTNNNNKYRVEGECLIYDAKFDNSENNGPRLVQGCMNSEIPEGIVTVSAHAFKGCKGLESITVPSTVAMLEEGTFENCVSLETIVINNPELQFNGDVFSFTSCEDDNYADCVCRLCKCAENNKKCNCTTCICKDGENKSDACKNAGCKSDPCTCKIKFKDITVPEHLIAYFIDKAKLKLTDITVTAGESIANNCFEGCSSLTTVALPDELVKIGNYAFANCTKLERVIISESSLLESIGAHAFDGCSAFKQIVVHTSVADEASDVFVIPSTVTDIGDYAFRGCAIETLNFEDTKVERIGYKVFADCRSLNCINISSGVTDVDFDAFTGCANLKEAHLSSDFIRALSNAKDLDHTHCEKNNSGEWLCQNHYPSIQILDITGGEIIDSYYIREMKSLQTLIIGDTLTHVDNRVFEGCSKLDVIKVAADNATYHSKGNCLIENATGTLILGSTSSVIPEEVKTVSSYAFAQSDVPEIVIPATVELVEKYAFSSCRSLVKLEVESSNTVIAEKAFDGCDGVKTAIIPASVIPHVSQVSLEEVEIIEGDIPAEAFKDCITLKKVTISDSVSSIGENALEGCDGIIAITAPASILLGFTELPIEHLGITSVDIEGKIDKEFLAKFPSINSLYLNDFGSDKIAVGAFANCDTLETLDVPAWALSIIPTANVKHLTINSGSMANLGVITLPNLVSVSFGRNVTDIKALIFANSPNLAYVDVEAGSEYTAVENRFVLHGNTLVLGAFDAETDTETVLPENVTKIGDYAFAGRANIGELKLHEGIVTIGDNAFYNCASLVINSFPGTIESVGKYAFFNCVSLTSIKLEGAAYIGEYAFFGCSAVTEIVLPKINTIGKNAFYGCDGVTEAAVPVLAIQHLPKTIVSLEIVDGEELAANSIEGFENLTTLVIGATVKKISSSAINAEDNKITSITVSENNEYYKSEGNCVIGIYGVEDELYNLGYLVLGCNSSVIPEGVTEIKENSFLNCTGLTEVIIPASVTSLDPLAFKGCTSVEVIEVAQGNETYYSKDNCVLTVETVSEIETVVLVWGCKTSIIPAEVVKIGNYAFAYSGIVNIKLPVTVKEIGSSAFEGAKSLVGFYVYMLLDGETHSLTVIGAKAFAGCENLEEVIIPNTVTEISSDAFSAVGANMTVFWYGTQEEWDNAGYSFDYCIYSSTYESGYWYYNQDNDGTPVAPRVW